MHVTSFDLSSPWTYGGVIALALVDGVVPLVPARASMIGIGVLAGAGDHRAYPLLAVATGAAFVSDNIAYWIGAHIWPAIGPKLFAGRRARRAWRWVEAQLTRHGPVLVALARVLPGGPTPITLTAGSLQMPLRRFRRAAAISAVLWSTYAFGLGVAGDALIGGNLLLAFAVALTVAAAVNLGLRGVLHGRKKAPLASDRDPKVPG